jgi:hypothetical protein
MIFENKQFIARMYIILGSVLFLLSLIIYYFDIRYSSICLFLCYLLINLAVKLYMTTSDEEKIGKKKTPQELKRHAMNSCYTTIAFKSGWGT